MPDSNFTSISKKTGELHNKLLDLPFIDRYQKKPKQITEKDRLHHLCQLLPIYKAIEEKLKKTSFGKMLENVPELTFLLNHSANIQKDLDFFREKAAIKFNNDPLTAATKTYVAAIEKMTNEQEIFAHFFMRIFGDIYGGPHIALATEKLIQKYQSSDKTDDIVGGLNMISFSYEQKQSFKKWIDNQILTDETFNYANQALEFQIEIFKELEAARTGSPTLGRFSFHAPKEVPINSMTLVLNKPSENTLKQSR